MTTPYTLLIIKPMTIGRGQGPRVLQDILERCPVSLRMFRSWSICDTTLYALTQTKESSPSLLDYEVEKIHVPKHLDSWIGIFTHLDRMSDPTEVLNKVCGPIDPRLCVKGDIRHDYGGYALLGRAAHPSDTVVHISDLGRAQYESNLLFLKFDESLI